MTYTVEFLDCVGATASDLGFEDGAEGANSDDALSEVTRSLAQLLVGERQNVENGGSGWGYHV